ncbi:MAG TPA: GAF domain-containing protein [Paracoccaceae bacterium]|nr:GAF domain-containing protein [Paracoccaceae bacterium]HMO71169.1 GAF domain-containing protein [Paracoccaceae bacterium]
MTDPTATFAELHRAADELAGARLFTVTAIDRAAGVARRAYSSHPADYPVTGTKPMRDSDWSAQVIGRGESFVANSTAAFAPFFPDHALINALGCAAAMNIPVLDGGIVRGTVNVLDVEGHFTPARVAALEALVARHSPDILAALAALLKEPPHDKA